MNKPYKAEQRKGFWICIDTRTGEPASYPATKSQAQKEAAFMNKCYNEALSA